MDNDPMSYYNDPALTSAGNEATNAASTAMAYNSAAALLPQKLKEAVMAKVDYNKDIITQQNKAQAEYFAAPSQAREKYQDIWNPFQREALVATNRSQAYAPYATLSDILAARTGSLADIINAGTGAFNADVTAKQGAAELARQKYADLFSTAQAKSNLSLKEKENAVAQAQWKYEQTHKNGSGSDLSALTSLLANYALGQNQKKFVPKYTGAGDEFSYGPEGQGSPTLKDPATGSVYEYDSFRDPDYMADMARGYVPVEEVQ